MIRSLDSKRLCALALAALMASCTNDSDEQVEIDVDREPNGGGYSQPAPPAYPDTMTATLALEVDVGTKQLTVYRNGTLAESYPVAVGTSEWPTRTGEWRVQQVIWNPKWVPPDEEWAKEEEPREPGDPENPLGRAQIVYDAPRSIHGTNDPSSIGKAVSHGSIRVANDVAVDLAGMVMEAGGATRDQVWFDSVQANPTREFIVELPRPVAIRVVEGSGRAASTTPR